MEYLLKSGVLYGQDQTKPLARIKSCFYSPEKQILSWDNTLLCRAQVQHRKGAPEAFSQYFLCVLYGGLQRLSNGARRCIIFFINTMEVCNVSCGKTVVPAGHGRHDLFE